MTQLFSDKLRQASHGHPSVRLSSVQRDDHRGKSCNRAPLLEQPVVELCSHIHKKKEYRSLHSSIEARQRENGSIENQKDIPIHVTAPRTHLKTTRRQKRGALGEECATSMYSCTRRTACVCRCVCVCVVLSLHTRVITQPP